MGKHEKRPAKAPEHPTDKYARSDEGPPPGEEEMPQHLSDEDAEDVVDDASEDSYPASDPPAYTRGTSKHNTNKKRKRGQR